MAQEQVNAMIQAFQRGMQQVQEVKQQEQQEKQFQSELAVRKQEQADRENQQKIQNTANEKLFNLQQAAQEHQVAQNELAQSSMYQRTGITPAGAVAQPGLQSTPQQPLVLSGLENSSLIFPTGHVLSVPPLGQSPEIQLAQHVAAQKEAADTAKEAARQQAETQRQLTVNKATQEEETKRFLAQINLNKAYEADRTDKEIRGRLAEHQMDNAQRLRDKMIDVTGGLSEYSTGGDLFGQGKTTTTPDLKGGQFNIPGPLGKTINQSLTNIYKGQDSLANQEKVNPKYKQMISSAAAYYGVGSLDPQDVTDLKNLQIISQAAPILQQMHQLKKDSPTKIDVPFTDAFSKFNSLDNQLQMEIPKMATSLSGSKRMSKDELATYLNGLVPSRLPLGLAKAAAENEKYNKFVREDIYGRAKDITQGLPENQQNGILSSYGFTRLPSTVFPDPNAPASKDINWIRSPDTGQMVRQP